jgi:hypothetical protein
MRAFIPALIIVCAVGCESRPNFEAVGHATDEAAAPANAAAKAAKDAAPVARRIVHTAQLELLADDIEAASHALLALVEEYKGFVAGSETGGAPGQPRSGSWTVRVPVAKYPEFVEAVGKLGERLHAHTDAKDVTEEFVDTEARLKNKRVEEERLQDHLKNSTGKLEEILTVERELARVRGEIEQAQGHMQKLASLSDLATVTVSLRERKSYTPPESPAFSSLIGRTFGDSLDMLVRAGKAVVLVAVAITPWLPVLGVIVGSAWLFSRRKRVPSPPSTIRSAPEA